MGEATDVYGTNFYPPFGPELALDYCRGTRGELLILEQRSGHPHWDVATRPGWMRLWAYRSIAHGACGINYFRWRPCRWGQEEYWHAILPHSGRANRRYKELKQMGEELAEVGDLIDTTKPQAETAIVMSYESRWGLNAVLNERRLAPIFRQEGLGVHEAASAYHTALMDQSVTTDAMDPREDLSKYKLVIAPRLYSVDEAVADNLTSFVREGGVLCLTPRSGVVDEYNKIFNAPAPGPLAAIAGVEVDDYGALERPLTLDVQDDGKGLASITEATAWADEVILTTAQPLATYGEGWQTGMPAITINTYGKGKVVYVGTLLRGTSLNAFVAWLCALADVEKGIQTPDQVRAYERRSDDVRLLFLLNFGESEETVTLGESWTDLFAGDEMEAVTLQPADVCILERPLRS
jgi:beta-galactosidase